MKSLTTETALDILIVWLQDNIDCESGIIFDNDEDKTDSAALLPCVGGSSLTFRFSQLITDRLFILTGSPVRPVSLLQFSIVIAVISSGNEARTPCHNFLYADNHFPVHLPVAGT
ncbi:TPA: hypothetical protein PBR38_004548 [Escherichia coli]|nr:DUF957 domain-containing protein [Escherichia coli]HAU8104412.1 DUF957 domain-containing protein [Escherichia coli]HAU8113970.1 DUF957 domain-containing protein [Escherichia coli]HDD9762088.1 hypothetical protein [Escherichia coli]HDD9787143.1 hypothetical protein [Escherichia coli]